MRPTAASSAAAWTAARTAAAAERAAALLLHARATQLEPHYIRLGIARDLPTVRILSTDGTMLYLLVIVTY
jgi:hypothetical protein